jgi:hypothetical protein
MRRYGFIALASAAICLALIVSDSRLARGNDCRWKCLEIWNNPASIYTTDWSQDCDDEFAFTYNVTVGTNDHADCATQGFTANGYILHSG